jgi:hypothetical protein
MAERSSSKSDKNNSNRSIFNRKSSKLEKKMKNNPQGEFLNNKRNRLNGETGNNFSIFCNEKLSFEDQIEFSSKNVVSSSKLFNKDNSRNSINFTGEKKNKSNLDYFLIKTNSSNNNNTSVNTTNTTINTNNNTKINNYFQSSTPLPSVEILHKQLTSLKEKNDLLVEERNKLIKDYNDKKRLYDKEIEKLIEENNEAKETLMNYNQQYKVYI